MPLTDIAGILILIFLMARGAHLGFLRTLLGPACFAIATLAAFIWFKTAGKMLDALIIAILGPMVLNWIARLILDRTLWKNGFASPNLIGRIGGAAVHMIWGGAMFLTLLVLAVILPLENFRLGDIKDDIKSSFTYRCIEKPLQAMNILPRPAVKKHERPSTSQEDLAAIANDPKIQQLLADPQVMDAVKNRDVMTLMSNPLILEVTKDPELIAKLLKASTAGNKQPADHP